MRDAWAHPSTHPARIDAAGPASSPSLPRFDFLSAADVGDILPTGPQFVASCVHNQHILTAVPGVFMCPPTTRHTRTSARLLFILLLEGKPDADVNYLPLPIIACHYPLRLSYSVRVLSSSLPWVSVCGGTLIVSSKRLSRMSFPCCFLLVAVCSHECNGSTSSSACDHVTSTPRADDTEVRVESMGTI